MTIETETRGRMTREEVAILDKALEIIEELEREIPEFDDYTSDIKNLLSEYTNWEDF